MEKTLGIYVHLPFCPAKCGYCNFTSFPAGEGVMREYSRRVIAEAGKKAELFRDYTVDTVYFGGGTPSFFYRGGIAEILNGIKTDYGLAPGAEVTAEANPESLTAEKAEELAGVGVNRVSVGLQSANDGILKAIGRRHTALDFAAACGNLKSAGITNISADIMLGLPGQSEETLNATLDFTLKFKPSHVSAYALKLEPGTPMYSAAPELPDDDAAAELYDLARDRLTAAGLLRYEVSNFALPEKMSRHNLKYWTGGEYLGLGTAAHSYYKGMRAANSPALEYTAEEFPQSESDEINDRIMLGLRLESGLDTAALRENFGIDLLKNENLPFLTDNGFIIAEGERIRIAPDKFYLMNSIIIRLLV